MVLREQHLGPGAVARQGRIEVLRPALRVAHRRAAQRQDVVQRPGRVLGRAQRPPLREIDVHLGRRLGARRQLEFDLDAVDDELLRVGIDQAGRRDQGHGAADRHRLAESGIDLAERTLRQQRAILYWARRLIALPAITFSLTASSMKPAGAMICTRPALTSASSTTPLTPPKWSTWLWV